MTINDKDCQGTRQGGEAVEVVAYRGKDPDGGEGFVGARWPDAFGEDCIVERLMTVAQHQRILAASVGSAEPVAWHTEDQLTDKSATTYDPEVAKRWRAKGWPVTPLYTHPADQVAERNAELVELLRGARAGLDNVGLLDSYIDYDAVSAISTRIDAKLASLKGVEE